MDPAASDTTAWRVVRASVAGTSHVAAGAPCQDASLVRRLTTADGEVLIAACADGAGTARLSHEGAAAACAAALDAAGDHLARHPLRTVARDAVASWLLGVRTAVVSRAAALDASPRDLACTLLLAVVGRDAAVFAQVGDGAIVVDAPGPAGYAPVTWPQAGEYANTTYFATDPEAPAQLAVTVVHDRAVDEVALFTDGLQALALRFEDRSAHAPFFRPMFAQLRAQPPGDAADLADALRGFLDSPAVNARTDDDKTLVLATRRAAAA